MCNVRWLEGRASGAVYGAASLPDLDEVTGKVYAKHIWSNPLHPDLFPNVQVIHFRINFRTSDFLGSDSDTTPMKFCLFDKTKRTFTVVVFNNGSWVE